MSDNDDNIEDVLEKIAVLTPGSTEAPTPASLALAKLHKEIAASDRKRSWFWPAIRLNKRVLASLAVLLVVIIAFTIPGVRAAANDFLGLFRVQKFTAISISPEQLAILEKVAESGSIPGKVEMIEQPGDPYQVDTLQQAEADLSWTARTPTILEDPDMVYVIPGGSGRLTIDVESARSLLEMTGTDPNLLPESLDGAPVEVVIYSGISQQWNNGVVFVQAPSPLVEYPEDADPVVLGQILLQAIGMDEISAAALARSIDWTSTLLVPIPEQVASFEEVTVDGASGLALSSLDGNNTAMLWERDGIVYALSGTDHDELVKIAHSLN